MITNLFPKSASLFVLLALSILAITSPIKQIDASQGVGISTGKISYDDAFTAGQNIDLPAIGVINTGDEKSKYKFHITYLGDQIELKPSEDWFEINKSDFELSKDQSVQINIKLKIPTDAKAGKYFAFLEAEVFGNENNNSVGIAAATKLSFEVKAAPTPNNTIADKVNDNKNLVILFTILLIIILAFISRKILNQKSKNAI